MLYFSHAHDIITDVRDIDLDFYRDEHTRKEVTTMAAKKKAKKAAPKRKAAPKKKAKKVAKRKK